jgi:hypothetical protein
MSTEAGFEPQPFQEGSRWSRPIRDLGLKIEGSRLEPIIQEFLGELERVGIRKLKPRCYLSTEWGVPGNIAIGIPYYLANPELTKLHEQYTGHVEGFSRADILRYLRHEMGHVVNYAYKLYDEEEWVKLFGSITQPYEENYRPVPYSRRYVIHLPGFYAQKHPDEDWAETFAVWMTPGRDWRQEYAGWPEALAKLEYCDWTMTRLADTEPQVTDDELDEPVEAIDAAPASFYPPPHAPEPESLVGVDGALRSIFEDLGTPEDLTTAAPRKPAAALIHRLERELPGLVFRWTGHFPEHTRDLLHFLAERAAALNQVYPEDRETQAIVAITTLVTALAMNHVCHGTYLP